VTGFQDSEQQRESHPKWHVQQESEYWNSQKQPVLAEYGTFSRQGHYLIARKPRRPNWLKVPENRRFTTEVHFFCNKIANGG
jgi:hypothetical protein